MDGRRAKRAAEPAEKTPPDVKKLRKERKNECNQKIALELVMLSDSSRKRADKKVVQRVFEKYKRVYGEELVSKGDIYRFRNDILKGNASSWLPPSTQFPDTVAIDRDVSSNVSAITGDSPTEGGEGTVVTPSTVAKKGGRPKNSTKAAKLELEERAHQAKQEAAEQYAALIGKKEGTYVPRKALPQIIEEVEEKYGVAKGTVNIHTVRSRVRRNNTTGIGKNNVSPVAEIEPIIVDFCIKLARMGAGLRKEQVCSLANSLLDGTEIQKRLASFKMKCTTTKATKADKVGARWYENFMRRHREHIKRVSLSTADDKRWTFQTRENFQTMYDNIYQQMEECGAAVKFQNNVMYDATGNFTDNEDEMVGLPSPYFLIEKEMVLFVDEMGDNTNQKAETRVGQEKIVVPTDGTCNGRKGSAADAHYTLLVFQAATGEPVCACVIFKSDGSPEDIPLSWRMGIDWTKAGSDFANLMKDEEIINKAGEGVCIGGPVCTFMGKQIPPFITCSPKASVTSDILAECLAHIDSSGVFDDIRAKSTDHGPCAPFLLLDGHHSRFELPFLTYIHEKEHLWRCCIGVPYNTQWWQTADAEQANGSYKMSSTKAKRLIYKAKNGRNLQKTDIIPIINMAWKDSFARVNKIKHAIAQRGWNPLNYALMTNKDLVKIFESKEAGVAGSACNTTATSSTTPGTFSVNTATGPAAEYLNLLIQQGMRDEGKREQIRKQREQEEQTRKNMNTLQRITTTKKNFTSGHLMNEGDLHLGPRLLTAALQKKVKKDADEAKKEHEKKQREEKKQEALKKALAKHALGEKLVTAELLSLLRYVHCDEDGKLPSKVEELRILWDQRKSRLDSMTSV